MIIDVDGVRRKTIDGDVIVTYNPPNELDIPWYQFLEEWWSINCRTIKWVCDWGEWVIYRNGYYQRVGREDIDEILFGFFDMLDIPRSQAKMGLAIRSIQSKFKMMLADFDRETRYVNCKNGLVDLLTNTLIDHSPDIPFLNQLNIEFHGVPAPTPLIDKIRAIYPVELFKFERFIQAIIYSDMSNELMCFLYGPTRSGKGTITNLVRECFKSMCSFSPINALGDTFGLAPLVGKRINLDSEMSISYIDKETQASMKKIVGNDAAVQINKKGVDQFEYMFRNLFFISVSNQLPKLPATDTDAWFSKVWLVNFGIKQLHPDPAIKEGVLKEMDDWISELILMPYYPLRPVEQNLDEFIRKNAEAWYESANPLIHICKNMFEKGTSYNDFLWVDDAVNFVNEQLVLEGYGEIEHAKLKGMVTAELTKMGITQRRQKQRQCYYPIRLRERKRQDQWESQRDLEEVEGSQSRLY